MVCHLLSFAKVGQYIYDYLSLFCRADSTNIEHMALKGHFFLWLRRYKLVFKIHVGVIISQRIAKSVTIKIIDTRSYSFAFKVVNV